MRPQLWLFGLAAAWLGCGGRGSGGSEAPPATEPPPPPAWSLHTEIGIDPLAYRAPTAADCQDRADHVQLPSLASPVQLDGVFGEWAQVPPLLDDPAQDAPTAFDLTGGKIAASGDHLALALSYRPGAGASLNIEFGGITSHQGRLQRDLRRLFRVSAGSLEQFEDGRWQSVEAAVGAFKSTDAGTELWLSRRLLGDVVTWPLWWVRLFTRDEHLGRVMDTTAAAYFPSLIAEDHPAFSVARCSRWPGQPEGWLFSEIKAVPFAERVPAAAANAKPSPEMIAKAREDSASGLVREAFSAVEQLLPRHLPAASVTLLLTRSDVDEPGNSLGIDPRYLGADDAAPGGREPYGKASLYRHLTADTRSLSPASSDPFPEATVFTDAATRALTLVLLNLYPAAPRPLLAATRQALLDGLIMRELGLSFWFDHVPDSVAPFLAQRDTNNPVSLGAAPFDGAPRLAKAVGFGHLLASEVDPASLVAVWSAAGSANAAASLEAATNAFAMALISSGKSPAARDRLRQLTHGWLDGEPYDAAFAPSSLDDKDADGLLDYYERKIGTNPEQSDSDGDGWSDLAEVLSGTDPNSASSHPFGIVPDGDFSDWQELLPKRLASVATSSGSCPKAAAIEFYGGLATAGDLLIGAVASDYWPTEAAPHWEVALDFTKDSRQYLVVATAGSRTYQILSSDKKAVVKSFVKAAPIARRSLELAISREVLGLTTDFNSNEAVKIRLRTAYRKDQGDHFCSQTDWFSPYQTTRGAPALSPHH